MDAKRLYELAMVLYGKKQPLDSLHQEIADAFYPERAHFTLKRSVGMDFASNLMTSYPAQCRRDLGNMLGTMLRNQTRPWFHLQRRHVTDEDFEVRQWLQTFEETQRRAMYDPAAMLTRAAKEGDHDFATFGQCAISVELNPVTHNTLLYRCWHLKEMAWQEKDDGQVGSRFRRSKVMGLNLERVFKNLIHQEIKKKNETAPFEEWEVMHMVVEAELYDKPSRGRPWWGIWWDVQHECVIQEIPMWTAYYRIPRWQTVSGSQYSYSPATTLALPDARLIQAMTFTLLEAGEKATSPPMIATIDAVRSDISTFANGVTWVDPEYDEKMGEALRPITQDFRGFNFGVQMNADTRQLINKAFYLDKLTMPPMDRTAMTAYEVSQRVQQYIRDALPIFEPMEQEYNAGLCDDSFEILWRNGAFGSPVSWPQKLRGADIEFTFESPLHDAIEEQKGQLFMQGEGLMDAALKVDPSIASLVDGRTALRSALLSIGWPANWMRSDEQLQEMDKQAAAQAQMQQVLEAAGTGAKAASDLGAAAQSFSQAQPQAATA